jgi:hypothetical protein
LIAVTDTSCFRVDKLPYCLIKAQFQYGYAPYVISSFAGVSYHFVCVTVTDTPCLRVVKMKISLTLLYLRISWYRTLHNERTLFDYAYHTRPYLRAFWYRTVLSEPTVGKQALVVPYLHSLRKGVNAYSNKFAFWVPYPQDVPYWIMAYDGALALKVPYLHYSLICVLANFKAPYVMAYVGALVLKVPYLLYSPINALTNSKVPYHNGPTSLGTIRYCANLCASEPVFKVPFTIVPSMRAHKKTYNLGRTTTMVNTLYFESEVDYSLLKFTVIKQGLKTKGRG